jgi:hypothetical protein
MRSAVSEVVIEADSPPAEAPAPPAQPWPAPLSDARLTAIVTLALFVLGAWPLLLVKVPPLQDLPNHLATARIIAHPELYPEYAFNGFFKSNSLLALWLHLAGGGDLLWAARVFTAAVIAANAVALPLYLLHFCGRRGLLVGALFVWPLVHSFSVSMGFLNFAFAFAVSLLLLVLLDQQRARPTVARGAGIAAVAGVLWYAHPFPLAVAGGLAALDVAARPGWRARRAGAVALLLPLAPAGLLALVAAQHHMMKAAHTTALAGRAFSYLNPWESIAHLWTDASGAFTWWGSATLVPAVLLPWFAWKQRRSRPPFFSNAAIIVLAAAYFGLPVMLSNWWHLNCRLVPFLWVALALRVPRTLPRPVAFALVACALASSAAAALDYVRLDRDRAEFTAGMDAVPARAPLLPLMFKRSKTSTFTASLTHAWGYYSVAKDTSAPPLVFAVERSYPITYREFPPEVLIPPALDRFAEFQGTPAQVCKLVGRGPDDAGCNAAWRELWASFWRKAEPRFSYLLTWAMPDEARPMIPARYRRTFAAGALEIYAQDR